MAYQVASIAKPPRHNTQRVPISFDTDITSPVIPKNLLTMGTSALPKIPLINEQNFLYRYMQITYIHEHIMLISNIRFLVVSR